MVPRDSPINKLTIRLISDVLAPTAASAPLPAKRPATIISAAPNISCSTFPAMIGSENRMTAGSTAPFRISILLLELIFISFSHDPTAQFLDPQPFLRLYCKTHAIHLRMGGASPRSHGLHFTGSVLPIRCHAPSCVRRTQCSFNIDTGPPHIYTVGKRIPRSHRYSG